MPSSACASTASARRRPSSVAASPRTTRPQRAVAARRQTLEHANARLRARSGSAASLVQADRERSAALLHVADAGALNEREGVLVLGARVELAEARMRLETLEHLEERRRREHREAALREEEALLQDVVQARAARRAQMGARR